MSLTNVSWNATIKCIHDINDPNTTIVINQQTFQPLCKVCGWNGSQIITINVSAPGSLGGQYTIQKTGKVQQKDPKQEKIDAFDRAMGIVGK